MKYIRLVQTKDLLIDPKLGKPSLFWAKTDDLIKIFSASSDPEIAKVYIDGTAEVFKLSTKETFKELGFTGIYDLSTPKVAADDSYPIDGHKYTTSFIGVIINEENLPLSPAYVFNDQGYSDIYKAGEMVTDQTEELPEENAKTAARYFTGTYIIYVDSIEKAYHVKTGMNLTILDMKGLATYVYDYKTSEWIAFTDTTEFNEESKNRYYLSNGDSFANVYIDGSEKKLSSAFIYKYQGYSEDEVGGIYQITSDFSEGASCCAKKPQADNKMATESTVTICAYDGNERKFSTAYTFEEHGLTPAYLYLYSADHKEWIRISYDQKVIAGAMYTTSMTEVSIDGTYTTAYTTNYTWAAQGVTKLYDENRLAINCDKDKPIENGIYYTSALA